MPQWGSALRQDHSPLEQHRAQLIGQPGPRRDQSLARPVQHLQIELRRKREPISTLDERGGGL
jgi:hypothetical protein